MARILEEQGSNFITFQCFQLPTVFQRKMCREGWFIGQLSLSALCSLNVDSRSRLNYICRVLRMSFLKRIHNFPVTHEAALLSFCTTSVIFHLCLSQPILAPHWLRTVYCTRITKIIASTQLRVYPKPWLPFCFFPLCFMLILPWTILLPEHQIPHVWHHAFLPFPPAILSGFLICPMANITQKRAFLGSPFPGGLFTPQHPESPLILVLPWFLWLLWWPVKGKEERSRGKLCFGFRNYSHFIFAAWECLKPVCMEHSTVPSVESQSHFSPANMINWELQGMGWLVGTSSMCKQTAHEECQQILDHQVMV